MPTLPKTRSTALALSAVSFLSAAVYGGAPSVGAPKPAAAPDDAPGFGITGDWGGLRTSLVDAGFNLTGSYAGEWFGVVKGGKSRGGILEGLAKLTLDVNLEKVAGWQGATFRISGLAPQGSSPTAKFAGDASIVSNIDSYDTVRLVDFWLEQRLLEDKLSLKIGQLRVDDEFGVTDTAGLFINSSFGVPNTAFTPMPLATYPSAALGIRARIEPIKGLYGQLGLYDGNPSSGDYADPTTGLGNAARHGTDWALRSSEGVLWAGEIGYQRCCEEYPGAYRLGFLHHTDSTPRLGSGKNDSSNTSLYYVLDQTLWQKPGSPKEGLSGFIRGNEAQERRNDMHRSIQTGLVYTGLAASDDKLGLAYAHNKFNRNSTLFPGANYESIVELSYQVQVAPSIKVQPDLQYIKRPGGTQQYGDAWVLGVRAIVEF